MPEIPTLHPADVNSAGVLCDSCGTAAAALVLSWPDSRFRVCESCVGGSLLGVAEPLDPDDELATTDLNAADRARERGAVV